MACVRTLNSERVPEVKSPTNQVHQDSDRMNKEKTNRDCATLRMLRGGAPVAHVPPAVAGVPPGPLSNAFQRYPRNPFHLHDETAGQIISREAKKKIANGSEASIITPSERDFVATKREDRAIHIDLFADTVIAETRRARGRAKNPCVKPKP